MAEGLGGLDESNTVQSSWGAMGLVKTLRVVLGDISLRMNLGALWYCVLSSCPGEGEGLKLKWNVKRKRRCAVWLTCSAWLVCWESQ